MVRRQICRGLPRPGTVALGAGQEHRDPELQPDEKAYTYYGVDNSGMTMTSIPHGTVKGDTWTYDDENYMGGKKVKTRVTIKELSPTAYSFRMEAQGADGKWAPLMESKATKTK